MTNRQSIHTILALWAILLSQNATAQQRSSIGGVDVVADRIDYLTPLGDARIDTLSQRLHSDINLAEQIQSESSIYTRSYGPGLASTVSRHGYSPSQTSVYWNGVPLNSPALGLSDLSTLPAGFQVILDEGAAGALYGSGYMGGGIHLYSQPDATERFMIRQTAQYRTSGYSSFSTLLNYSHGHFGHSASFDYGNGPLDFKYTDLYGVERRRLGADQEIVHLKYNGHYTKERVRVDWGVWTSELDRGIPRSISESYTVGARQFDQVARGYVKLNYVRGPISLSLRSSGYVEDQRYSSTVINDTNIASALYDQMDLFWRINDAYKLVFSLDHAYQYVEGSSKQTRSVNRYGSSVALRYTDNLHWSGAAGARIEHQLSTTPLIPFISAKWTDAIWEAQLAFRSHFRFPTLNDLYWSPGGNPNLQPELGNTVDFHAGRTFGEHHQHALKVSTFFSEIDNYIQWVPAGGIFEPRNVKAVQTAGASVDYEHNGNCGRLLYEWGASYTWTDARTIESQRPNDPSINKQLIYTPRHKGTVHLNVLWNENWEIRLTGGLNGKVHTSTDNQEGLSIPSFVVLDSELSYSMILQNGAQIRGAMGLRNMTNEVYSFQRFYPMPGIQAVFSLTIQFAKHET